MDNDIIIAQADNDTVIPNSSGENLFTGSNPPNTAAPDVDNTPAPTDISGADQLNSINQDAYTTHVVDIPASDTDVISAINNNYNNIVNLIVLILIFVLAKFIFTRFLLKTKQGENKASENLSYSISVFSLFISLSIILTSVIYGNMPSDMTQGILKLVIYSFIGIILLLVSGVIFDKIALRRTNLNAEIANGNIAASLVDTGNFIASGLIIAASLKWYEFKTWEGITAIIYMYVCSQVILTFFTLIRKKLFRHPDGKTSFEAQLVQGNKAAAITFTGREIGTALAITAATNLLPFQEGYDLMNILTQWVMASIVIVIFFNIISWVASRIVLWKDVSSETVNKNINTALIDAAVYIGFGLILSLTLM